MRGKNQAMETAIRAPGQPLFDRQRAQAEWLQSLPEEIRRGPLRPREVGRLLDAASRYLVEPSPQLLAELGAEVYRIAREMEARSGFQSALRYLRDALARALTPAAPIEPEAAGRAIRLLCSVTDSIWEAHAHALEETLAREQRERLHQELALAKRIQERLLPRAIPQIPGYDIAGRVLPAAEVGGDYWSCKYYPEDGVVTFKLADVTGHGIAAATLVAAVKFISGGYYRGAKSAAQVMERTNHVLVKETPHEILVTMVYGWLYPDRSTMTVVNAGHSPVLFYRKGEFRRIEPTGLPLGLMETTYGEVRLDLEPGDLFLTCSDGITEPSAERRLGEEWVMGQVAAGAHLRAAELVERILQAALDYYGAPLDDMSILVIRRTE